MLDADNFKTTLLEEQTEKTSFVKIYSWDSDQRPPYGHTALEIIYSDDNSLYISFGPEDDLLSGASSYRAWCHDMLRLLKTPGEFKTKQELKIYSDPNVTEIHGLNIKKITKRYEQLKSKYDTKSLYFGLSLRAYLCSSLVLELLRAGGFNNLLPAYGQFGHPYHLLLLALRPTLTIALMSPFYYSVIVLHGTIERYDHLIINVTFACLIPLLVLLEKLINHRGVPWLSDRSYRKRSLVEICAADSSVQIATLLGIGFADMIFRELETKDPQSTGFKFQIGIDFALWLSSSLIGFLTFGLLSSFIVYSLVGLRAVVKPAGIQQLAHYIETTHEIPSAVRRYQFLKEYALIAYFIVASAGSYFMRRYYVEPFKSFFIGSSTSALAGYLLTKLIVCGIDKKLEKELARCDESKEKLKNILTTHDPKPEQFALLSVSTAAGIVAVVAFMHAYVTRDTLPNAMASFVGGLGGFLIGATIYEILARLHHSCFINNAMLKAFTWNEDPLLFKAIKEEKVEDALVLDSTSNSSSSGTGMNCS